jgi:FG-GAP repeat
VTGSDDGRAYVLSPVSEDRNDWNYQITTVADYGLIQTVSGIAAADVDGDGYAELFVSVHNMNYVQVYSFSPAAQD